MQKFLIHYTVESSITNVRQRIIIHFFFLGDKVRMIIHLLSTVVDHIMQFL